MLNYTFNDWIVAAEAGDGRAQREESIIANYAKAISEDHYTLAQLVIDLGPYVTPEANLINVARALALLPPVFSRIQSPSKHEIHTLIEYFCARLRNEDSIPKNRAGIQETAACLQALASWPRFILADAAPIVEAIFVLDNGTQFSSLAPASRVEIFKLVDFLFRTYSVALKRDLSGYDKLVAGLVSLVELEKNPSSLGIIFPLYTHISQQWALESSELKKIWDSFIRYYPITLGGGGPRDPAVPSKEQLRDNLLQCIISNNGYSSEAFPYFIERLDVNSDLSANIKTEVFETIVSCVTAYSVEIASSWSIKLWDALKFEIWNGENDDFIEASLRVITAIGTSLSSGTYDLTNHKDPLGIYVLTVATECNSRLHDSKKQYAIPNGKILQSISSSSPYAFYLVIKTVLPSLLVIWQDLKLDSEKKMILGVFNSIVAARLKQERQDVKGATNKDKDPAASPACPKQISPKMENALQEFRDGLVEIYSGVVSDMISSAPSTDISYGIPAIQGLALLFQIPKYILEVEMAMVAQKLNSLASRPDPDIHSETLRALQQISASEPRTFKETTLPNFLDKLLENLYSSRDPRLHDKQIDVAVSLLQDLILIGGTVHCRKGQEYTAGGILSKDAGSYWHGNFNTLMEKLLEKLGQVLQLQGKSDYTRVIISAICACLESFDEAVDEAKEALPSPDLGPKPVDPKVGPYTYIVFALFRMVILARPYSTGPPAEAGLWYSAISDRLVLHNSFDDPSVQLVGRIAMTALRSKLTTPENNFLTSWDSSLEKDAASGIWTLFAEDSIAKIVGDDQMELVNAPPEKCLANILSTYLIAGLRPEAKDIILPRFPIGIVAANMIHNAINVSNKCPKIAHISMLWMLQLLVNKFSATSYELTSGGDLLKIMQSYIIRAPSKSPVEIASTYQTLAYFTAASLSSFDKTTEPLINLMIAGIPNPAYGRKVAESFRLLLAPSEVMNKENFCKIRPLRYQRLLTICTPLFSVWKETPNEDLKENYLIAYAGILGFMPPSLLVQDSKPAFEGLLPLILEGTNVINSDWTKKTYITLLLTLLPLIPDSIVEHLDSVINRMTDRTHNTCECPSDSDVACRALALEVLAMLTTVVAPGVLVGKGRKYRVLGELGLACDDCSRTVRRRAEQARGRWLYLEEEK